MQAPGLAALSAIVLYVLSCAAADETLVLVFTRTDCPISNRYAPEVTRLYNRFRPAGVRFRLVYVDRKQSAQTITVHRREYAYPFEAVLDPRHELATRAGVRITPEVAVYSSGRLVYRGRIDNRYIPAGKSRPAATVHDLEETLAMLVAGKRPTFRDNPGVGCYIEDVR